MTNPAPPNKTTQTRSNRGTQTVPKKATPSPRNTTTSSSRNTPTSSPDNTTTQKKFIKKFRIFVTQEDIDNAHQQKSNGCMIQNAIKRDKRKFVNIWVDKYDIRCTDPKQNCIYTFPMPVRGRVALLRWDDGEQIKPFDIWLRNPIVRERVLKKGIQRPKSHQNSYKKHVGAIPRPKSKEARLRRGRDRSFGQKLWTDELTKLKVDLGVLSPNTPIPERNPEAGPVIYEAKPPRGRPPIN